jgi:hypothetical protein
MASRRTGLRRTVGAARAELLLLVMTLRDSWVLAEVASYGRLTAPGGKSDP